MKVRSVEELRPRQVSPVFFEERLDTSRRHSVRTGDEGREDLVGD